MTDRLPITLAALLLGAALACSDEDAKDKDAGADAKITPDVTLPDAAPAPSEFTFFVYGDTRTYPTPFKTGIASIVSLDPKAVALFNTGDITTVGSEVQWKLHVQNLKMASKGKIRRDLTDWDPAYIRYLAAPGNHDAYDFNWHDNWQTYLPGQKGLGLNTKAGVYFSVTYEDALFVVLDSEHPSSAQTAWLKKLLEGARAKKARWRFAFFHKPVYPCNYKLPFDEGIPWVRLFEKHRFHVVFLGHAHTYERTCPMVGGTCKKGGVIYVTTGGGGAETASVDITKEAKAGADAYHCTKKGAKPGILVNALSNWHHYCHVAIDGAKMTLKAYPHDATTGPKDVMKLSR